MEPIPRFDQHSLSIFKANKMEPPSCVALDVMEQDVRGVRPDDDSLDVSHCRLLSLAFPLGFEKKADLGSARVKGRLKRLASRYMDRVTRRSCSKRWLSVEYDGLDIQASRLCSAARTTATLL